MGSPELPDRLLPVFLFCVVRPNSRPTSAGGTGGDCRVECSRFDGLQSEWGRDDSHGPGHLTFRRSTEPWKDEWKRGRAHKTRRSHDHRPLRLPNGKAYEHVLAEEY